MEFDRLLDAALGPLGDHDLASTVGGLKTPAPREANRLLNRIGSQFWAKDYFDRRIRDGDHEGRVAQYIENNPVKAAVPLRRTLAMVERCGKTRLKARVPNRSERSACNSI